MVRRVAIAVAVGTVFATAVGQASTGEQLLPPNLTGTWTGAGKVQKNETSKPLNVKCTIEGTQSPETVGFSGECRAMLFLKREISAELTVDGDRFTGLYTGSNAGPAKLDGTMTAPGKLTLNMTFEREVNGDDQAVMTIDRSDPDRFTITTVDRMISGVEVTTSEIAFERD